MSRRGGSRHRWRPGYHTEGGVNEGLYTEYWETAHHPQPSSLTQLPECLACHLQEEDWRIDHGPTGTQQTRGALIQCTRSGLGIPCCFPHKHKTGADVTTLHSQASPERLEDRSSLLCRQWWLFPGLANEIWRQAYWEASGKVYASLKRNRRH